jgi:hypothetical protein
MKPEKNESLLLINPDKKRLEEDSHKARSINFWGENTKEKTK